MYNVYNVYIVSTPLVVLPSLEYVSLSPFFFFLNKKFYFKGLFLIVPSLSSRYFRSYSGVNERLVMQLQIPTTPCRCYISPVLRCLPMSSDSFRAGRVLCTSPSSRLFSSLAMSPPFTRYNLASVFVILTATIGKLRLDSSYLPFL